MSGYKTKIEFFYFSKYPNEKAPFSSKRGCGKFYELFLKSFIRSLFDLFQHFFYSSFQLRVFSAQNRFVVIRNFYIRFELQIFYWTIFLADKCYHRDTKNQARIDLCFPPNCCACTCYRHSDQFSNAETFVRIWK